MSMFTEADYALINLGVCIKGQADRLGIEHEGVPLEGVVVRIAERALAEKRAEWEAEQGETEWAVRWVHTESQPVTDIGADEDDVRALVLGQEGYAEAIVRTVSPWLPVPDTTNTESEGKA